ncbi:hypothetical protein GCM10022202_27090 [Microbacterium marinilacus]|uniref:Uncharacterized protein n=1 Tax=Microbacterium marinilacus TaxID=415209 RepID=A0ABP7BL23_9MICO
MQLRVRLIRTDGTAEACGLEEGVRVIRMCRRIEAMNRHQRSTVFACNVTAHRPSMEDHATCPRPTWRAKTEPVGWTAAQSPMEPAIIDCTPTDPRQREELLAIIRRRRAT